jgi:hypothetical protein
LAQRLGLLTGIDHPAGAAFIEMREFGHR